MRRALLAAVPLVAVLAACTSPATNEPAAPQPSASPSAAPAEGPVTVPHTWPNGLTMKVAAAEKLDPKLASSQFDPATQTLVKVTAVLTNPGPAAVPLRSGFVAWRVLAGPNRAECDGQAGWNTTVHLLRVDLPQQVGAGQSLTVFDSSAVPTDLLGVLAVQTGPALGDLDQWTFTGVEALLQR